MTEGIIQKVIKNIVLDKPATWYHRSTFITLEQELIEEIKKELDTTYINRKEEKKTCMCSECQATRNIQQKLIGDNQE